MVLSSPPGDSPFDLALEMVARHPLCKARYQRAVRQRLLPLVFTYLRVFRPSGADLLQKGDGSIVAVWKSKRGRVTADYVVADRIPSLQRSQFAARAHRSGTATCVSRGTYHGTRVCCLSAPQRSVLVDASGNFKPVFRR